MREGWFVGVIIKSRGTKCYASLETQNKPIDLVLCTARKKSSYISLFVMLGRTMSYAFLLQVIAVEQVAADRSVSKHQCVF